MSRRPRVRVLLAAVLLTVAVIAAACDNGSDSADDTTTTTRGSTTSTTTTTTPGSTAPPATSNPDAPCEVAGATEATKSGNGEQLVLLDEITPGRAGCASTVTFDFRNPSTIPSSPGFTIGYEAGPFLSEGAGEPVTVAGSAFLVLRMSPVDVVDLSVDPFVITYDGPPSITPPSGGVREIRTLGAFEAQTVWVLGLDSPRPFTAVASASPPRLVITVS